MRYHSTLHACPPVGLKEAVLRSLPPDRGLYMPERLPRLGPAFWDDWRGRSFHEIALAVAAAFFGEDVPQPVLAQIIDETLRFDAPLVELGPDDHILELFHGPTLAFKDFGARFMARLMAWLIRGEDRELIVLVATSGDTGGAVASAFHQVPGIRVVILYPSGKVSRLQEKQLTTLGGNIHALEVAGSFDDCQRMVKAAFLDADLTSALQLTSANSINIARLVPQSFYYIRSAQSLPGAPAFVVPSGNFGNLTAGLLAQRLGLPVTQFVAATNGNDVVPRYLASGRYEPRPSRATISNAMDVGAPSNFPRLMAIAGGSLERLRDWVWARAYDDAATRAAIGEVWRAHGYVLDPHGAVGWLAARDWRRAHPGVPTIALGTAHPAKFLDVIEAELGPIEVPARLAELAEREKLAEPLAADERALQTWLRDVCGPA